MIDNFTEAQRLNAYQLKADPLFFKWQAGECTKEEWLVAREAVKEEFKK